MWNTEGDILKNVRFKQVCTALTEWMRGKNTLLKTFFE